MPTNNPLDSLNAKRRDILKRIDDGYENKDYLRSLLGMVEAKIQAVTTAQTHHKRYAHTNIGTPHESDFVGAVKVIIKELEGVLAGGDTGPYNRSEIEADLIHWQRRLKDLETESR